MTAQDTTTLDFYAAEAAAYAARGEGAIDRWIEPFLALLPSGARVLELGCGAGQDSEAMLARGFDVVPSDGTPELAREAERRLGRPVRVLLFAHIDEREAYDGIWANACLLHVPRAELPGILGRIHRALRPGGAFYASYKAGMAEGRDGLGRFYNYPSPEWLRDAYGAQGWQRLDITLEAGTGYDKAPTDWLHVMAVKG